MLQILLSALTALVIVWLIGPLIIPLLARIKPDWTEREIVPEPQPQQTTKKKQAPPPKPPVPTMGGVMALFAVTIATLIFGLDGME